MLDELSAQQTAAGVDAGVGLAPQPPARTTIEAQPRMAKSLTSGRLPAEAYTVAIDPQARLPKQPRLELWDLP